MARKGKFEQWLTKEGLLLVGGWARDGLTDEELAKRIGINVSTLYDWKNKFPEFSEALKINKEIADYEVENALRKRALGYSYEDVAEKYEGGYCVERKRTVKHVPADTTAQIFWLKNRQPDKWRSNPQPGNDELFDKLDSILGGIDAIANE